MLWSAALICCLALAQDPELVVRPEAVDLSGQRSVVRMVVTGVRADGRRSDLTRAVRFRIADPRIASVTSGVVRPRADGRTTLWIEHGQLRTRVPVVVTGTRTDDPIAFREVLAAMTRYGCNTGSCHGSPKGKGGLALSLFGFDPEHDDRALVRNGFNRFLDFVSPRDSLLLEKASSRLPHTGGRRMPAGSRSFRILEAWIGQGARYDRKRDVRCRDISIEPAAKMVRWLSADPGRPTRQQLRVVARMSDGTTRDVTGLASFATSDGAVARVDTNGLITALGPGDAAIIARYLDRVSGTIVTFVREHPGFDWKDGPARNYVDEHVDAKLVRFGVQPAELCSDGEFLRRVRVDLTGLLPTIDETRSFLESTLSDKRERKIDELLAGDEHARFAATKLYALLGPTTASDWRYLEAPEPTARGLSFVILIAGRCRIPGAQPPLGIEVLPEVITSLGPWTPSHRRIPVPVSESAYAQALTLGQDLSVRASKSIDLSRRPMHRALRAYGWLLAATRSNMPFDQLTRHVLVGSGPAASWYHAGRDTVEVVETTSRLFMGSRIECARCHNHPYEHWTVDDFYSIASVFEPGITEPMRQREIAPWPRTENGRAERLERPERRSRFVTWLTSKGNPFFARTTVNRIWSDLMGRGIVEPADDFRLSNPPANEALLDALAGDFESHGFDRNRVIRTILRSRAYQRSHVPPGRERPADGLFAARIPRLLTPPQLIDALSRLCEEDDYSELEQRRTSTLAALRRAERSALAGQARWERRRVREITEHGQPAPGCWRVTGDVACTSLPDGIGHVQKLGLGASERLVRTIEMRAPGELLLSVLTDYAFDIRVNGRLVVRRERPTDAFAHREEIRIPLATGNNRVVIAVQNHSQYGGFWFRSRVRAIDPAVARVLSVPPAARDADQQRAVRAAYLSEVERVNGLRAELARIGARLARRFSTQFGHDPSPDASPRARITRAFTGPVRDGSCTCEQAVEPTLDQALELLNGEHVNAMVTKHAARLARLPQSEAIDRLYLAAFCRLPADEERRKALAHLAAAADSGRAMEDLVWAIINTKEFMFRH